MESDSGMRLCTWFAGIDLDSRCLTATLGFTSDNLEPRILGSRSFDAAGSGDSQALLRRSLPELGQWLHLETGGTMREVALAVPGSAMHEYVSSGEVNFSVPTLIDGNAIDLACERAELGPSRLGLVVQSVVRSYQIDGMPQIQAPVGVYATSLKVESTCWIARQHAIGPIVGALRSAGLEVGLTAPRAVAAARSTLTKLEQRDGAILVMVGEHSTECAVIVDDKVEDVFTVSLGTSPLEAQIARACNVSPDVVRRLDLRRMLDRMPHDPIVQRVRTVLSVWGSALFSEVRRRIDERNLTLRIQSGIVIAAAARQFPDLDEQATRAVGMPARFVAMSRSRDRRMATTVGSFVTFGLIPLQWNAAREPVEIPAQAQPELRSTMVVSAREPVVRVGFGQALGRWLREFVPADHYSS